MFIQIQFDDELFWNFRFLLELLFRNRVIFDRLLYEHNSQRDSRENESEMNFHHHSKVFS